MVSIGKMLGGSASGSLIVGALVLGGSLPATAAGPDVPVFSANAAQPAVARVIGQVKGFACRTAQVADAEPEAIERLKQRAVSEGATAVVNLSVKVRMSPTAYLRGSGFPNPCRFETDVKGTAVVLTATQTG
jgi:uncharacterized protein YbjQ (UPF0145 family)